jgi:uncharacterized protein YecT (DUF1311 family)
VQQSLSQLEKRLVKRNATLDEFLQDKKKVRSYLIRSSQQTWMGHRQGEKALFSQDDISSEEKEEIAQLCRRIYEIEQELHRLNLIAVHLQDEQIFELPFDDLVSYGFEASLEAE